MKKNLKLCFILNLLAFSFSCASIQKSKVNSKSQHIKLQQLGSPKTLQVYNDHVKIHFAFSDVINLLEKDRIDENNRLKEYLNNNNEPIFLTNNMQLRTEYEAALFPIVWVLLKKGKAKVFYNKNDDFVNKIKFVKLSDFSGKQEYFRIIGGDIFLNKIITIGE